MDMMITFKHGENDFSTWTVDLPISIFNEHMNTGCSIRGNKKDILNELSNGMNRMEGDNKMENINEFSNQPTKNHQKYLKLKSEEFDLKGLIEVSDIISYLCQLIGDENEIVDHAEEIKNDLDNIITKFMAKNEFCPHCGNQLFLSDLPQYNYVCHNCNENF